MKLRHATTILAAPILSLTMAICASSFAAAPDNAGAQGRDRTPATVPGNSTTAQQAPGQSQREDRANTEAQGRSDSQQPRQNAATPGAHECHEGAPGLADNDNAQGGNDNANINAQGSRADDNQSEQGATNSNAQIAQGGDDCLPGETNRRSNDDARGQGTGATPGNPGNGQTRRTDG